MTERPVAGAHGAAHPAAAAPARPFVRAAGAGPAVVCLHSNASTSSQWRALSDRLADRYRVVAVDGYGAGQSPPWPRDRAVRLSDETALLAPVLDDAGPRVHLVGHSYGAAVALKLALQQPQRVLSVAVYEPTLFSLIDAAAADGIVRAATDAAEAVARGDLDAAGERFIDYWMGAGAWARMPEPRRAAVARSMVNVAGWRDALLAEPAPRSAFAALDVPVLLMYGDRSPESSRAVARVLAATLPRVVAAPCDGLGHMGPLTDPEPVNARIERFLLGGA